MAYITMKSSLKPSASWGNPWVSTTDFDEIWGKPGIERWLQRHGRVLLVWAIFWFGQRDIYIYVNIIGLKLGMEDVLRVCVFFFHSILVCYWR